MYSYRTGMEKITVEEANARREFKNKVQGPNISRITYESWLGIK